MKKFIKAVAVLLVTSAMLLGIIACDNRYELPTGDFTKEDIKGSIKFETIGSGTTQVYTAADALIRQFKKDYPDVTVKLVQMNDPNTRTAKISAGTIGDVFWLGENENYKYAIEDEVLLPLNEYISRFKIETDNIYQGILDLGRVDGTFYMIPRDYNQLVCFYNKTELSTAGITVPEKMWTWDEFAEVCKKLTHMEDDKYSQVGADFTDWEPMIIAFMYGWGGQPFDMEDKKVKFVSDDKVYAGLNAYLTAMNDGWMKKIGMSSEYVSGWDITKSIFNPSVFPNMVSVAAAYDSKALDWDICEMPLFPTPTVTCGASGHAVFKRTKNPVAAAAFCTYLWTEEGQTVYNSQEGASVPPIKSLSESDFWKVPYTDKNYDAYVSNPQYNKFARFGATLPYAVTNTIVDKFTGIYTKALKGDKDLKDSLRELEEKANQAWDKLK